VTVRVVQPSTILASAMRKMLTQQKTTLRPHCLQWAVRPSLRRGACRGQQGARDEIVLRVVIINGLAASLGQSHGLAQGALQSRS
jgi:hypothetical protein